MLNYHIPTKNEQNTQRKRQEKTQLLELQNKLFEILLLEYQTDAENGLFSPFDLETKKYYIKKVLNKYEKNNILLYDYNFIYYVLMQKYDTLANKAKKYHKLKLENERKSLRDSDILPNTLELERAFAVQNWGRRWNAEEDENKGKKGLIYILLGLFIK